MKLKLDLSGIKVAESKLKKGAKKGLEKATFDLMGEAQRRAPVDTGDLRGSASADFDGFKSSIAFETPYARRQHEHLEYNHPRGGEAKYLERPLNENKEKYMKQIADEIKKSY